MHELVTTNAVQKAAAWTVNVTSLPQWLQPLYSVYGKIVLTPMARLYLWGPAWGGWGFWGGKPMHDICAQITNLPSDFWLQHQEECIVVVSKTFYSLVILFETLLYVFCLYWIIKRTYRFIKMLLCKIKQDGKTE